MADWDYVLHVDGTYATAYQHQPETEVQFLLEHGTGQAFQFMPVPIDGSLPPIDSVHQAYYYAAIRGIEVWLSKLSEWGIDTHAFKVQICTSRLVANQVMGKWEVNDSVLFMLCAKLRALLSEFKEWEAISEPS